MVLSILQVGIKDPEKVAIPAVRNEAALLYSLVGVTSVLAVLGGQLPGDWVRTSCCSYDAALGFFLHGAHCTWADRIVKHSLSAAPQKACTTSNFFC